MIITAFHGAGTALGEPGLRLGNFLWKQARTSWGWLAVANTLEVHDRSELVYVESKVQLLSSRLAPETKMNYSGMRTPSSPI